MSHTNFLYHIVCGTKERRRLISPDWEDNLHAFLGGIVRKTGGTALEINGIEDHVHMLARLGPKIAFSDFMRELKSKSSGFVHQEFDRRFAWAERYGAFSVSESNVERVRRYIKRQKLHHARQSFVDEYRELLIRNKVEIDERYLI